MRDLCFVDKEERKDKLEILKILCMWFWFVCLLSFFLAGSKVQLNIILSLSTSFRYKNCNKQKSNKRNRGVDPESDLSGDCLHQIGECEQRDKWQHTHQPHSQPDKDKYLSKWTYWTLECYPLVNVLIEAGRISTTVIQIMEPYPILKTNMKIIEFSTGSQSTL